MFARRIWLSFLTLFCAVATCMAQQDNASIIGTVFDSSGAVIPGAKVLIQNEGTAATVELTTGQSGTFAAPILSIGSYKVTASASGQSWITCRIR